jgi:hypothetical protein
MDGGSPLFGPQDLKDFVRAAGEVTYADVDRDGRGYFFLSMTFNVQSCGL